MTLTSQTVTLLCIVGAIVVGVTAAGGVGPLWPAVLLLAIAALLLLLYPPPP